MHGFGEHYNAFHKFCRENNPLRKIRRKIDMRMTQKELAEVLGCHWSTVGAWERGFDLPPRHTEFGDKMRQLAKLFGVDETEIDNWSKVSRAAYRSLGAKYGNSKASTAPQQIVAPDHLQSVRSSLPSSGG